MRGTTGKVQNGQTSVQTAYNDLKNKWADSAYEKRYSIIDILCFFSVIFLLGYLSSISLMFTLKDSSPQEVEVEIVDPSYITYIEGTAELIDYAASKNGGEILFNLSSPEFHGTLSSVTQNNLNSLISDSNGPEECWPSLGTEGFATVRLAARIFPTGFSVVLPSSFLTTIPKKLSVFSVDSSKSNLLGTIEVKISEKAEKLPKSVFAPCLSHCQEPTQVLRLEVEENYGDNFTCVYQFKAHGLRTAK